MSVVFDNNIWISYAIGKQLNDIPILLKHPDLELFACNELLDEFERVRQYPKLQKFLTHERAAETFELMLATAVMVQITARTANFTDAKDNYLLDRCNVAQVDFLVTGDKLLLALETFNKTRILSYRAFCAILEV
jgi:putative PIN family toxin of toxin-antitoxin system